MPTRSQPDDPVQILVVDDHPDMRAYLVRLLGRTHRVEAAAHPERAWARLLPAFLIIKARRTD